MTKPTADSASTQPEPSDPKQRFKRVRTLRKSSAPQEAKLALQDGQEKPNQLPAGTREFPVMDNGVVFRKFQPSPEMRKAIENL